MTLKSWPFTFIAFFPQGLVNDLDLEYISKNYFSLTAPQDITGSFYFQNGTMFEHLKVDSVKLDGHIRGLNE